MLKTLLPVHCREDSNFQVWTNIQGADVLAVLRGAGAAKLMVEQTFEGYQSSGHSWSREHPTTFWPCGQGHRWNLGLPWVLEMNVTFLLCRAFQQGKMLAEHSEPWRCVPDTFQSMYGPSWENHEGLLGVLGMAILTQKPPQAPRVGRCNGSMEL